MMARNQTIDGMFWQSDTIKCSFPLLALQPMSFYQHTLPCIFTFQYVQFLSLFLYWFCMLLCCVLFSVSYCKRLFDVTFIYSRIYLLLTNCFFFVRNDFQCKTLEINKILGNITNFNFTLWNVLTKSKF